MGALAARLLLTQKEGEIDAPAEWMDRGLSYLLGIYRLEESGYGKVADYRRTWFSDLATNGEAPQLANMMDSKSYHRTAEQYGDELANEAAELGTVELIRRF